MAGSEFSIIRQYFSDITVQRDDVTVGIGDDCALLRNLENTLLAVSIDTLVEGVHFFADVAPRQLGYKSLAVSLSDLAAMGAEPAWFTLALTLPAAEDEWLSKFAAGLAEIAALHNIQLVGGDTTRGPLTISIQVHGHVSEKQALRRDTAKPGDLICVSGCLGDAGAALQSRLNSLSLQALDTGQQQYLQQRLERPTPRNQLGLQLRGKAHAAIDISDGLLADLQHILKASSVGAQIYLDKLPLSAALQQLDKSIARQLALGSGDDYELCFTVPAQRWAALQSVVDTPLTCIGEITERQGLCVLDEHGKQIELAEFKEGYDHFT